MNCKEEMEMIRMGLPCHLGRVKEMFIFWCRVCQIQINCGDTGQACQGQEALHGEAQGEGGK